MAIPAGADTVRAVTLDNEDVHRLAVEAPDEDSSLLSRMANWLKNLGAIFAIMELMKWMPQRGRLGAGD